MELGSPAVYAATRVSEQADLESQLSQIFGKQHESKIVCPRDAANAEISFVDAPVWPVEFHHSTTKCFRLESDFYRDDEHCQCMGCSFPEAGEWMSICHNDMAHEVLQEFEPHAAAKQRQWFLHGDIPLTMPSNVHCIARPNMIYVDRSIHAATFGNRLISLLEAEAEASIMKVDRRKFSVALRAHFQGSAVEFCVRVYAMQSSFAAEFQRRSGDCVAFFELYRLVARHFGKISWNSSAAGSCSAGRDSGTSTPTHDHESLFLAVSKSLLDFGKRARDMLSDSGGVRRVCGHLAAAFCRSSTNIFHGPSAVRSEELFSCDV